MPGSISEFQSSFKKDIARPNKFQVDIPIPLTLLPYIQSSRNLSFRCEAAQLPGRTFATLEQRIGSNPIEKFPYETTYNDIDLTFIVDDDMNQKVFFDAWMNYMNPTYNYNHRYKSDYATILTVTQYDVTNQPSYSVNMFDAFPVSMNQLDLDWSNDGYHKLSVTFAYTYWKNNSLQALGMEVVDAGIGLVADALGGLNAFGGIGTGINSIPESVASGSLESIKSTFGGR
jgi:hypothetical protein